MSNSSRSDSMCSDPLTALSLYDIETGLADVLAAREEAETPEEMAAADAAIVAYCQAEVAKADGIAAYVRHCRSMHAEAKAEAKRLAARADAWDGRRKRLLDTVQRVMESMGKRRIDGKLSTLLLKGNGGKQAVIVDDESLVPDEYFDYAMHVSGVAWQTLMAMALASPSVEHWLGRYDVLCEHTPRLSAICEALQQPCPTCHGKIADPFDGGYPCSGCGDTGKQGVPGCRLAERGQHVEVK